MEIKIIYDTMKIIIKKQNNVINVCGSRIFGILLPFLFFIFCLTNIKKESIIKHTKSPINHYLILVGLLIYFDKP